MCGIAGFLDLTGARRTLPGALADMAAAIVHRGPDEDGFLDGPGVGLACRRLSIVGLADGRQPVFNEDRSVAVVFNGELFDYPEWRAELAARGHVFRTHTDTEVIPHLWEEHGEGMFAQLRGQFAVALWDAKRRVLVLGRDRFGICPLHWARVTRGEEDWLLFGSEVKAILASGLVEPRADPRGLDCVFNFFSVPAPLTCFSGVQSIVPGRYRRIEPGEPPRIAERAYWTMDFPDAGGEERGQEPGKLADRFEGVLYGAVSRRLRADVPVVAYLSGGVDSSTVVAMASKALGRPIPTFTIKVREPGFDETGPAGAVARHVGSRPVVVDFAAGDVVRTYPEMIRAGEAPVVDVSTTGLLLLARSVHEHGYKVTLTGEGSDEWLAGYPWFRVEKLLRLLDRVGAGQLARRAALAVLGGNAADWWHVRRAQAALGGPTANLELYALVSLARRRFYGRAFRERLGDFTPYEHLGPPPERFGRWHPLHRSLYWNARIHLGGHLLSFKSDRIAMHSSVEARYPFLDEEVFDFLAPLDPSWKLRGFREKYLLRLVADRWLPRSVARRPKQMFWSPYDAFSAGRPPAFVEELLSEASLRRTGYFDVPSVRRAWEAHRRAPRGSPLRTPLDMGLVAVLATQLWHHTFLGGGLADLPTFPARRPDSLAPDGARWPTSDSGEARNEPAVWAP